jgi:Peptidase C10 family/Secretion system C-terminal sorting domain
MYHCGVSVDMSYSYNGSGAYVTLPESYPVNCAEYALKTYFHYKSTVKGVVREGLGGNTLGSYYTGPDVVYCNGNVTIDSIAESTWISMLQAELTAGRPMLYEGTGTEGGHCWVCDGWETTSDMFHFNWGWSGASNGYYTVDNLAPPALGAGGGGGNFNYDQGVVMGIVPDSFPSNPGNIELQAHLNCTTSSPAPYGTAFSMTTKILNAGSSDITSDFAAQVFDTSNNLVATLSILPGVSIAAGDSSAALTFADSNATLLTIPVSYHNIRVMYRASGTTTWTPVANNGKFINYTTYDVMNDTDIALFDSLHVGSHNIVPGGSVSVSTTIGNQNFAGANFTGTLRAILLNVATGDTFVIQTHSSEAISNGSQISATFTNGSVTAANGTYALIIQHQYGGSGAFFVTSSDYFVNPILMTIGASTTAVPTQSVVGSVEVFPNPARETVNFLVTGATASEVRVLDITGKQVEAVRMTGGFASMSVNGFADGTYMAQIETANGVVTKKFVVTR